jgi:hypothetical protein
VKATSTSKNATAVSAVVYAHLIPLPVPFAQHPLTLLPQNGTTLIYPLRTQVSIHTSTAPLTSYIFGRRLQSHEFCPICGIQIRIRKLSVSSEEFNKWYKDGRDQKEWESKMPVNLRCFEDVEWDQIEIKRGYFKDIDPQYEV